MTNNTRPLDNLVDDIYGLFTKNDHKVSDANIETFVTNLGKTIKDRLEVNNSGAQAIADRNILRLSKLGTKDRRLWYEADNQRKAKEALENDVEFVDTTPDPVSLLKFLYGDIIEEVLLLLIREAGYTVEGEQGEVEVDGVKGHRDCIINGITVDIKSASKYAFNKFSEGTLFKDDPFGYIAQISSYVKADNSPYGAFLAMNKESGELALLNVDQIDMIDPEQRVKRVREVMEMKEPPVEKCYEPQPMGTSGNMVLHKNCGYCPFKDKCWSNANNGQGLRKFKYSNGVKYLTQVVKTPNVEEITDDE